MANNVNDIIRQLADIDDAAEDIIKQTHNKKAAYAEEITEKKAAFKKQILDDVDMEVSAFKDAKARENEKTIKQYETQCQDEIAALKAKYDEHSDEWVESIFEKVTKES